MTLDDNERVVDVAKVAEQEEARVEEAVGARDSQPQVPDLGLSEPEAEETAESDEGDDEQE
jgi:hypothetical protein